METEYEAINSLGADHRLPGSDLGYLHDHDDVDFFIIPEGIESPRQGHHAKHCRSGNGLSVTPNMVFPVAF